MSTPMMDVAETVLHGRPWSSPRGDIKRVYVPNGRWATKEVSGVVVTGSHKGVIKAAEFEGREIPKNYLDGMRVFVDITGVHFYNPFGLRFAAVERNITNYLMERMARV